MWLFDTDGFMARKDCGDWPNWLVVVAMVSDIIIGFAYMAIPLLLGYFWYKRRRGLPHPNILVMFVFFIFFCGCTHFADALMYYWPAYRFSITLCIITAIISFCTVLYLPEVIGYFMQFKTPGEYKEIAEALESQVSLERSTFKDLSDLLDLLEKRIERLEGEIKRRGWIDLQNLQLDELKDELLKLKGKYREERHTIGSN